MPVWVVTLQSDVCHSIKCHLSSYKVTTTRVHKKGLFCARQFLILCVEQPYLYTCIGNSPRNAPSALRANASNSSSPGYTYTGAMNDMRSFNRLIT